MGMEQRGRVILLELKINQVWEESLKKAKPFEISKKVFWEAWKQVRANQGILCVDSELIADFERNFKDNLYARLRESKGYVGSNAKYRMSAFADQPLFCLHHMKFRSCGKSLFVDEV